MQSFSVVVSEDQVESKESNSFVVEQLSCGSDVVGVESMVEVDVEVWTEIIDDISCREMANTKQTKHKQDDNRQGSSAKFPNHVKPGGKVAKHLAARNDDSSDENSSDNESQPDNNNNTIQGTVRAGRRCHRQTGKSMCLQAPSQSKKEI